MKQYSVSCNTSIFSHHYGALNIDAETMNHIDIVYAAQCISYRSSVAGHLYLSRAGFIITYAAMTKLMRRRSSRQPREIFLGFTLMKYFASYTSEASSSLPLAMIYRLAHFMRQAVRIGSARGQFQPAQTSSKARHSIVYSPLKFGCFKSQASISRSSLFIAIRDDARASSDFTHHTIIILKKFEYSHVVTIYARVFY